MVGEVQDEGFEQNEPGRRFYSMAGIGIRIQVNEHLVRSKFGYGEEDLDL